MPLEQRVGSSSLSGAPDSTRLEGAAATAAEAAAGKSSATTEAAITAESRSAGTGARGRDKDLMHIRGHAVHGG